MLVLLRVETGVRSRGGVAICRSCAEVARRVLSANEEERRTISLELAWGGHEGREGCEILFSPSELSLLADTLVEIGIVAPLQRLPRDGRLRRAEDFLPDADAVVPAERIEASLEAEADEAGMELLTRRLGNRWTEFREFLSLASFHGGYTVRQID